MVPLPWYSSDMSRSRSSLLRSMPIYQAQLKRTAFRSFAPAAGVYSGAPPRPPRPPARAPPPAPAPPPPSAAAAGAKTPACAKAEDGSLTARATAITMLVPKIFRKTAIMIPLLCLVVWVTRGDPHQTPVQHDHGLEEAQRTAVPRRQKLHLAGAVADPRVITHSVDVPESQRSLDHFDVTCLVAGRLRILSRFVDASLFSPLPAVNAFNVKTSE